MLFLTENKIPENPKSTNSKQAKKNPFIEEFNVQAFNVHLAQLLCLVLGQFSNCSNFAPIISKCKYITYMSFLDDDDYFITLTLLTTLSTVKILRVKLLKASYETKRKVFGNPEHKSTSYPTIILTEKIHRNLIWSYFLQ